MAVLAATCVAGAGDWPTWRGVRRDGISRETGLKSRWMSVGPKMLWSVDELGDGYATVSVADGMIYTTGLIDDRGKLVAITEEGELKGTAAYGRAVDEGGYKGSRSTPTIHDGRIYLVSGFGVIQCFSVAEGKVLWSVDMVREFDARHINWHITESPLVYGDTLICTPGGRRALMAALDLETGDTVWRTTGHTCRSAYCSPTVVEHNGRDIILTMVEDGAIGVDAKTGDLLWLHEHKNKHAVHAATPIYHKGKVIVSSGYGHGTECLELSRRGDRVRLEWTNQALANHHGGLVMVDDHLYGTSDRGLMCLDPDSGDTLWGSSAVKKGALTVADGRIYAYSEDGVVSMVDPNPRECNVVGRFRVEKGERQHWAHPVVANGRLYIRHGSVLMAYDIK